MNAELEQWKGRVKELSALIDESMEERFNLQQKIAEELAEFKEGDRVLYRGEVFQIESIAYYYFHGFKYFARKVLKSGELGVVVRELCDVNAVKAAP